MVVDVKKHRESCESCQIFLLVCVKDRVPITSLIRLKLPSEVLYMECIGPLDPPSTQGHWYAVCIIYRCMHWVEVVPLRTLMAEAAC